MILDITAVNKRPLVWALLLIALVLPGWDRAYAAAGTDQKIDAVLVMDASTSMNDSDRNKVANEAMKMFVDMVSVQGDKIGLISYTDQIVREKALLAINSAQDKEALKAFIDQLARGAYTDIAVGVSEAVKVLEAGMDPDHYPLIVLLSDGNNSLNAAAGRTQAASDQELQAAVQKARDLSIPIYTIGLNADGQLNKDVLKRISGETGGQMFETSTANTLPQILSQIFANHLKLKVVPLTSFTANGQFQDITVPIPNANVMEANISVMSDQPVETRLFDPSGKERPIPSDGVVYSKSTAYSLLKLTEPAQGDWKLQIKGVSQDKISINLVYNYDLALVMDPLSAKAYKAGDTVFVSSRLETGGQAVADADLYKSLQGVLLLTDKDSGQTSELPLTNTGSGFTGSFTLADAHDYELKLRVEDANFLRESETVSLSAKGASGGSTASPAPASTADGEKANVFPWVIGGAALLLAALSYFAMRAVKKRNRGFYGQLVLEICDEDTGDRTSPQYKRLHTFKGKVKLHQLLQLAPELAETDKIYFIPGHDSVILYNQSGCLIEKSGRAIDASKGRELRNNDRIRITLQNVNKSIQLDYII